MADKETPRGVDEEGTENDSTSEPPNDDDSRVDPEAEPEAQDDAASAQQELPFEAPPKPAPEPPPPPRPLRPAEGVSGRANARMTLAGTSLVFVVTLCAWGGAKVACNLHPPRYEAFKPAELKRLTSTPKDAALEFHHRLALRDFAGAREIVTEGGAALVDQAESSCDDACLGERGERLAHAVTRAIVERREGPTAVVRAEAFYQGEVAEQTYRVKWEQRMWKVIGTE
jgi:hypothetical protein